MTLSKPFDVQALVQALKTAGLPDVEKMIEKDVVAVLVDWLQSSCNAQGGLFTIAVPLLAEIQPIINKELHALFNVPTAP